jgi:hypothetical protein
MEECVPSLVFASFMLVFALQLRKKDGKNLSQGKKNLNQAVRQAVEVYGNAPQWYVIRTLPNLLVT